MTPEELKFAAEYHRGFEDGRATRDADQWRLDRARKSVVARLQAVKPSELCGSHEILSAICKAIFEPPMGWTIGAGEILRDHLVYLLGGENVKLPAELDAEFSKNGENHQTGGYDVLGNERNMVVCELQKLRDRGSVWGRELVVALGLSVVATNDDLCDRLIYLLGGKSINKDAETSAKVIQNGEKYQLATHDVLGNERHKVVCELRKMRLDTGTAIKKLAIALGIRWNAANVPKSCALIQSRLIHLLGGDNETASNEDGSEYGLFDRIDGSGSCMGDSMGGSEHCEDTCDCGCERLTALDNGTCPNDDVTCPNNGPTSSITDELREFAETFRYEWYDVKDGSSCYTTSDCPPSLDSVNMTDYINGIADRIDEQFDRCCELWERTATDTAQEVHDSMEAECNELARDVEMWRDRAEDMRMERDELLDLLRDAASEYQESQMWEQVFRDHLTCMREQRDDLQSQLQAIRDVIDGTQQDDG